MATPTLTSPTPTNHRASRAFSENISAIPTPGVEQPKPKTFVPFLLTWAVAGTAGVFMICLGIALEIALFHSQHNNGFEVPKKNVFSFASVSFLTSFFPTLLVVPLSIFWGLYERMIKRYQPYIALKKGNARADDSLLVDYIIDNNFLAIARAFTRKHYLVVASIAGAIGALMYQPLAGSVFTVQDTPHSSPSTVASIRTLGLQPDLAENNEFLASAGYVEAAVGLDLPDPPFIHGPWAVADFQFPIQPTLNGTVNVTTTGIKSFPNCVAPSHLALSTVSGTPNNFTITANAPANFGSSNTNCPVTVSIDSTASTQQYGVTPVLNCGANANANVTFQPVFFWFFRNADQSGTGSAVGAGVYCNPQVQVFNVWATADLSSNVLTNVSIISGFDNGGNVTGPPLNGLYFNGVIFENSTDPFIQARATAVNSGVPGAVFRNLSSQPQSVQVAAFSASDFSGFVTWVNTTYTQYLSIMGKSIYFLPNDQTLASITTSNVPRLFLQTAPSHALAIILMLTGLILLTIQTLHYQARRRLIIAVAPGSIASTIALTSHSGFGYLLFPYDDEYTMRQKFAGLTFRLDERTGAVVCEEGFEERIHPSLAKRLSYGYGTGSGVSKGGISAGSGSDTEMGLLKDVDGRGIETPLT